MLTRLLSNDFPRSRVLAVVLVLLLVALAFAPFLFPGVKALNVAAKVLVFVVLVASFDLLLGYTGMLSFGHAAFFGGAAYVAGHVIKVWGLTPELGLLLGTLSGAFLGLIVGFFAIRRTGIYSTMITLALAQMLFFVALQAPFTGGEDGLQSVPRGKMFGLIDLRNDMVLYYIVLAIVIAAFLLIVRTVHSPFGQVLKAIKENEPRATSLGYDTNRFKLVAFVLSAALSGLAGALKAMVMGFATLSDVHWTASGHVVLMTLVGGLGTLSGPLVGSAVVVLLENKLGEIGHVLAEMTQIEWFSTLGESVTMVTGLIFIVCVLLFRKGIMGEIIAFMERRKK